MRTVQNTGYYPTNDESAWSSLVVVEETAATDRPSQINKPAAGGLPWKTASEIERADYEAARQLGIKRRKEQSMKEGCAAKTGKGHTWLEEDPIKWRGRKIRSRKSGDLFTVRQVFRSGRVELQKTFMLYLTNVEVIRADYLAA